MGNAAGRNCKAKVSSITRLITDSVTQERYGHQFCPFFVCNFFRSSCSVVYRGPVFTSVGNQEQSGDWSPELM